MKRTLFLALPAALLLACAPPLEELPDEAAPVEQLSATDYLLRASMALRGIRPSIEELISVDADPTKLVEFVDAYLDDPLFGETIRDMHAESLLLRAENVVLPALGPLEGESSHGIHTAITEAPLRLVEDIVVNDLPYTEVVQAAWTMTNDVSARIFGLAYDESGPEWQRATWPDDRPQAGVLSTGGMWLRHINNGSNHQRARANTIAASLLCTDFLDRDIPLDGAIDLSDDAAVADAVNQEATCVGCHQALDPLAATLWGFTRGVTPASVRNAYERDCVPIRPGQPSNCYPLPFYDSRRVESWDVLGLRAPGYFGLPADDLTEVGASIAEDPRFAMCAARRFYGYLTQTDIEQVPFDIAAELQATFLDSDFDAKALARAVVLHPSFTASQGTDTAITGLQTLRPEQASRMVEDLTGFRWDLDPDRPDCAARGNCRGVVDLSTTDGFGFRAMAGGIDGYSVTRPTHTMTPVKALFTAALAAEASGYVVDRDFAEPDPTARRLLLGLPADPASAPDDVVRAQLAQLHLRVLGEFVAADSSEVAETFALFEGVRSRSATATAYKIVLTALLQDVRTLFY
jgi:hypothetical protein